jgi:hypothetical protein
MGDAAHRDGGERSDPCKAKTHWQFLGNAAANLNVAGPLAMRLGCRQGSRK